MSKPLKFKAYIPAMQIWLTDIAIYSNGDVGVSSDHFGKQLHAVHPEYSVDWDGDKIVHEDLDNDKYETILSFVSGEYDWIQFDSKDCQVVEYIGKQDLEGKDIYEKDIIGIKEHDYDEREDYIDYYIVEFGITNDRRYGFYLSRRSGQQVFEDCFSRGKVCGNALENPQLKNLPK